MSKTNASAGASFNTAPIAPQAPQPIMPREIIRWLQTLTLSKPVRHPKRDFANGFVVAEISSRFVPTVDMRLFDNVQSTSKKQENWKALQKCLGRGGVPTLNEQLVSDVMTAKDGAGDQLLMLLYTQFTGRTPPGESAKTKGGGIAPPTPQKLDHIPVFVKNISGQQESASAAQATEATKQLSALAAEQLRAAELELMKQQTETSLRNQVLGLDGTAAAAAATGGAGGEKQPQTREQQQQAAQKKARAAALARAGPAVHQPMVQGQIRAVDVEAESSEQRAVNFSEVSMRQLSGAALQRFGFKDRSQSPSRNDQQQQQSPGGKFSPVRRDGGGTSGGGRGGGIGFSIHTHLCLLFDRFVADFFSASTTWNPPADSSPLMYFIENCSNANVITPSFKSNLWQFLHYEAANTAQILASAPIDTLYFVGLFANVAVEGVAPLLPNDASFSDFSKPKFFGGDAFDSTYYCHVVLGALHDCKLSSADAILRRYAFPAVVSVFCRGDSALLSSSSNNNPNSPTSPSNSSSQNVVGENNNNLGNISGVTNTTVSRFVSIRRCLFALSGLALGNSQPAQTSSIASCLKYFVLPITQNQNINNQNQNENNNNSTNNPEGNIIITTETTQSAIDDINFAMPEHEKQLRTRNLQQFVETIYDCLLTQFDATISYSSKILPTEALFSGVGTNNPSSSSGGGGQGDNAPGAGDSTNANSSNINNGKVPISATPQHEREAGFFMAIDGICASIRGDVSPSKISVDDVSLPAAFSTLLLTHIERGFSHSSSLVQELSLRALTSMVQVSNFSSSPTTSQQPLFDMVESQLSERFISLISSPKDALTGTASCLIGELTRLLCCTLRSFDYVTSSEFSSSSSQSQTTATTMKKRKMFCIARDVVKKLHPHALRDAERLGLVACFASCLSNIEIPAKNISESSSSSSSGGKHHQHHHGSNLNNTSNQPLTQDTTLPNAADVVAKASVSSENSSSINPELEFADIWMTLAQFCIDTLIALPPSALESLGNSGGSLPRALPSIISSSNDKNIFTNPLDSTRWSTVSLLVALASRFDGNFNFSSSSSLLRVHGFSKTGTAAVLKLQSAPNGFATNPFSSEFSTFLKPYRTILLLFTLCLARQTDVIQPSLLQTHRNNEDSVSCWQILAPTVSSQNISSSSQQQSQTPNAVQIQLIERGLGLELKKVLQYYDSCRKGSAAIAPRTTPDAEAFHEVYVQAGRAALYVVVKFYADCCPTISSNILSFIPSCLQSISSRVSQPASKVMDDDRVFGQSGLDVMVKAIEWFTGVVQAK